MRRHLTYSNVIASLALHRTRRKLVRRPATMALQLTLAGWAVFELGLRVRERLQGRGGAAGNWLALAVCIALPLPALLRRIHVEEAELTRVLGDPYRAYQARSKRLIPGLW